ncbi:hypothetical protein [Dyadobacter arcticus]|uniref:Outer membrane protein beta-barrel domain-containing protein n=1 Tax=Dyadobacter arcticus TaxID=1078754 RepID=A0ABX0UIL5_9BACT|nr:hypothetical protein [Dyadobacter arcticus]NIJ52831.1 hypothetical protein [Dyadobacter arcticus]
MKRLLLLAFSIFLFQKSFAQETQPIPGEPSPGESSPGKMLAVNIGRSRAGSGDLNGLAVGVEYEKLFRPKLSWASELGMTIHDGSDLLLVTWDDGRQEDLSYRHTTAGIQLAGKLGYHFVKSNHFDAGLKLGGLLRYQSSSLANDREILFPILTGYPLPVTIIRNTGPQRTVAVGGMLQLFGRYTFRKNLAAGFVTGIQADSNGDVFFPTLAVSIGTRF